MIEDNNEQLTMQGGHAHRRLSQVRSFVVQFYNVPVVSYCLSKPVREFYKGRPMR